MALKKLVSWIGCNRVICMNRSCVASRMNRKASVKPMTLYSVKLKWTAVQRIKQGIFCCSFMLAYKKLHHGV